MDSSIMTIEKYLDQALKIPDYQRPYAWTIQQARELLYDIHHAMLTSKECTYRLGTIVLHRKEGNLYIVDGQQRTITLKLLIDCLNEKKGFYLSNKESLIYKNQQEFIRLIEELKIKPSDLLKYINEKCEIVQVMIDDEARAFQFFDSQNARGKALEIHDLLKAYHLRAMSDEPEWLKQLYAEKWEQMIQQHSFFISHVLYPIKKWIRGQNAISYREEGLSLFKGLEINKRYPFATYHKRAQGDVTDAVYQLDQPILAGKHFFQMVFYYYERWQKYYDEVDENTVTSIKYDNVRNIVEKNYYGIGNWYLKMLYANLLLCYIDRFGEDALSEERQLKITEYCYTLRNYLKRVTYTSINKYVCGYHYINNDINLFQKIYETDDEGFMKYVRFFPFQLNDNKEKGIKNE